ncbi:MAG TPA: sensor protein lytS, partial [Runella sp.]|nr:sensor protein lytS [Runella sp.]
MYRRFVFWVFFVVGLPLWGKSDTLYVSHINGRTMLYDIAYCTTSSLNSGKDSLQHLLQQPQRWQRLTAKTPSFAQRSHWLRFFLTNDTDTTQAFYVYLTNANQRVTLFYTQHGQWRSTTSGALIPTSAWAVPYSDNYVLFNIPARATFTIVSRIAHEQGALPFWTHFANPKPSWGLQLQKPEYHAERILDEYRRNMPEFQYRSWIQGALALVTLFLALLYYQYRHRIYAYYGAYVLCSFVFSLLKTRAYTPLGQALGEWPLLKTHLMESLLWWGIGAYLFFMTELLDLSKNHPNMKKWFLRLAFVLMGYGGLYLTVMLLTNDLGFQQFSFWGGRFVAFPIYILPLFWIRRSVRSPMVPYVIWANVVLGFFGLLAWLRAGRVILEGVKLPANVDDLLTLSFAVVMEILVLSLAIAHRFRLNEKEKTESQRAYFQELQTKAANEKRIAETEMLA